MPSPAGAAAGRLGWSMLFMALAVLCGTGVWLVVQLVQRDDITLEIPIVIDNPTERTDIDYSYRPERVQVRFTFPAVELNKMNGENFRVHIPIQEIVEGLGGSLDTQSGVIGLSRDMVLPQNPTEINMGERNIVVSELLQPQVKWEAHYRQIPAVIVPVVVGEPSAGYTFDPAAATIEQNHETTTVLLSREVEEKLRAEGVEVLTLKTKPLDVTGKSNIIRELAKVELPEGVSLLAGDPGDRMVMLDITEKIETRTIENVPVQYEFLSKRDNLVASIDPPTVSVKLTGRRSIISRVRPDMLNVNPILGKTERAGITREVSVRVLLDREAVRRDPELESGIEEKIEAEPPVVTVRITSDQPEPNPDVTPSMSPTPVPTPALPAVTTTPTPAPPEPTPIPPTPTRPPPTPTPVPISITPIPTATPAPTTAVDDRPTS